MYFSDEKAFLSHTYFFLDFERKKSKYKLMFSY